MAFFDAKASQGTATAADVKLTAKLGSLAKGAKATVTASVKPYGGDFSIVVKVKGSNADPNLGNNTATTKVIG